MDLVQPCSTLEVGQLVLVMVPAYIKRIESIRHAFEQETNQDASILPDGGGFAQYIISHACACVPLPTEESLQVKNPLFYVAAQPLGTIVHACKKMGSIVGKDVAIVGQGQNGLIMTQMVANMGARRTIVFDYYEERLKVSKFFKATHAFQVSPNDDTDVAMQEMKQQVKEATNGRMCDIAIEMVGHQAKTLDICAQRLWNCTDFRSSSCCK